MNCVKSVSRHRFSLLDVEKMILGCKLSSLIMFLYVFNAIFAAQKSLLHKNEEDKNLHSRQKRFLIFPNGGTAKYIGEFRQVLIESHLHENKITSAGYLGPIDTDRNINCNAIRNFQFQYDLPPNVTTIFSQVPARQRSLKNQKKFIPDSSRKIAYEIVESILNKEGKNGHKCILRTICEVAESPVNHNGLVGELLQLFFTPGKHEKLHPDYREARKAGLNRVNCEKLYADCPFGHGILDTFSIIKEFKFNSWLNM